MEEMLLKLTKKIDSSDEVKDNEEVMGEDLNEEGLEGSSETESKWGTLPYVCLRLVFRCLTDQDRRSAELVCSHWHSVMRSPSLWRYRYFQLSGRLSKYRQSEYCSAVAYARSLGASLERLEVLVCAPRRSLVARRLEQTISGLLSELTRANAPLSSLSIMRLELDRASWTLGLRNSLVNCLILFLRRGGSKLNSICLSGMRNCLHHGLELLSAMASTQRRLYPRCYISSLDLKGFFSASVQVHLNSSLPNVLRHMPGLTNLSLSYSCMSDELLMALQHKHRKWRGNSSMEGISLQTFTLHCSVNEPHRQLVSGSLWATLASLCPDLKVKLTVDQVTNTNWLARILLPEMPLTDFSMTAFYSPDEEWRAKPVLRDMLPRYRRSLQHLILDLSNCTETLDDELLELVKACERLEELRVWAFLDVSTVDRLLQIRLTERSLLNKIRMRVYSMDEDTDDQEDQLEEILSSRLQFPPELEFFASVYSFV